MRLARAIFASKLPIISAVGHEIDMTIADFVADLRAPTPSAGAELLSSDQIQWRDKLHHTWERLQRAMAHYQLTQKNHLMHLYTRLTKSASQNATFGATAKL